MRKTYIFLALALFLTLALVHTSAEVDSSKEEIIERSRIAKVLKKTSREEKEKAELAKDEEKEKKKEQKEERREEREEERGKRKEANQEERKKAKEARKRFKESLREYRRNLRDLRRNGIKIDFDCSEPGSRNEAREWCTEHGGIWRGRGKCRCRCKTCIGELPPETARRYKYKGGNWTDYDGGTIGDGGGSGSGPGDQCSGLAGRTTCLNGFRAALSTSSSSSDCDAFFKIIEGDWSEDRCGTEYSHYSVIQQLCRGSSTAEGCVTTEDPTGCAYFPASLVYDSSTMGPTNNLCNPPTASYPERCGDQIVYGDRGSCSIENQNRLRAVNFFGDGDATNGGASTLATDFPLSMVAELQDYIDLNAMNECSNGADTTGLYSSHPLYQYHYASWSPVAGGRGSPPTYDDRRNPQYKLYLHFVQAANKCAAALNTLEGLYEGEKPSTLSEWFGIDGGGSTIECCNSWSVWSAASCPTQNDVFSDITFNN